MWKKTLDRFLSINILVLVLPIIIIIWILVRFLIGSPVIFKQMRPGLNAKPFVMYKFRTMTNECGPDGVLLKDEDRLTKVGKFLRQSSLDELPELWNVIKGDMSLVGPRPLLFDYLPLYSKSQYRRHEVLPGLTGWAQVNGRNALSWEEKFAFDVWYVENQSFFLDLKIIMMTIKKVITREGVSAKDHVTMPAFTGSKDSEIK